MPKLSDKQKKEILRAAAFMTQVALTVVACIAVGLFLGHLLDNLFGTTPWLFIVFAILGCLTALKAMIDLAKNI